MKSVILSGGVGAARFLSGLIKSNPPEEITTIVNTGDDFDLYGLYITPDIDSILYTLSGLGDPKQGWGIAGDTFNCLTMLGKYGYPTWFRLGDKDLATHIYRTRLITEGLSLSEATDMIRRKLGIACNIFPMTNDKVRSRINTGEEIIPFQDYFVKRASDTPLKGIIYEGIENAEPNPIFVQALNEAEIIVLAPSNPFVSIGPILALKGIRDILKQTETHITAISPIVGGTAIKGPAARMMGSLGFDVSPLGIAMVYKDILDSLIIDIRDAEYKGRIENLGIETIVTDTVMSSDEKKIRLAETVLMAKNL